MNCCSRNACVSAVRISNPAIASSEKSLQVVRDYGFTLLTRVLQPHRISHGFSVMIQKQLFCVFQLIAPEVKISIRKTLERIRKSYSFGKYNLKHEVTLVKTLLQKMSKLAISLKQFKIIYNYLNSCV